MASAISVLRRLGQEFQDLFFPKACLNCEKEGSWLCESCFDSLFFISGGFCPFCGTLSDLFCVCRKCRTSTGVEKIFSVVRYGDSLAQKLIKNFKYRYVSGIAAELRPLLQKFLLKYRGLIETDGAVLIPVPLHWYRECERGYNQAELLAQEAGKILNLPVRTDLAVKRKKTKNQANIAHAARFNNLQGAFFVKSAAPKNIILIDDVFTTGSTVKELASSLRSVGAEKIQVITLARG